MKNPFDKKEIVLGVTGSIACYKAAEIASSLVRYGARITVIMTECARQFVSPVTFQTISRRKVITTLFEPLSEATVEHISLAQSTDAALIAPATANIIGKMACGIGDDFLSTFVLARNFPIVVAPAMNEFMYRNPIVQENMERLRRFGVVFVEPERGRLACGAEGEGRLASVERILEVLGDCLKKSSSR